MKMARIILFTGQIDVMSEFYGKVIGLKQVTNEKTWREFDAGGVRIALHSGPASPGRKGAEDCFSRGRCSDDARNIGGARSKVCETSARRRVLPL
jgi:hypothetical protein